MVSRNVRVDASKQASNQYQCLFPTMRKVESASHNKVSATLQRQRAMRKSGAAQRMAMWAYSKRGAQSHGAWKRER